MPRGWSCAWLWHHTLALVLSGSLSFTELVTQMFTWDHTLTLSAPKVTYFVVCLGGLQQQSCCDCAWSFYYCLHLYASSMPGFQQLLESFKREIKLYLFAFHYEFCDAWKPQLYRGDPVLKEEFQRLKTEINQSRVIHDIGKVCNSPGIWYLIINSSLLTHFLRLSYFIKTLSQF